MYDDWRDPEKVIESGSSHIISSLQKISGDSDLWEWNNGLPECFNFNHGNTDFFTRNSRKKHIQFYWNEKIDWPVYKISC